MAAYLARRLYDVTIFMQYYATFIIQIIYVKQSSELIKKS